jgi:hypothetical protein
MPQVDYDARAVRVDGRRQLLLSGAIHYHRSTPAMWPELFRRSREAGLNCLETYINWQLHEPVRGRREFAGRLDIRRFVELAAAEGLHVILRLGPYICGEVNYGGLPVWLRDVPGIRFRTANAPFQAAMAEWLHWLVDYLRPCLASAGGPVILLQIENEYAHLRKRYGPPAEAYLAWCRELTTELAAGVPWFMCFGAPDGVLETINELYPHVFLHGPAGHHFRDRPGQPALCTELWTGWYDVWGQPHHHRPAENTAHAAARFLAAGGTGLNYYMWHGGTCFGREGMYLQTTSYDYSAPLEETGLPTTKAAHLGRLHALLHEHAELLLADGPSAPQPLGEQQSAWVYGAGGRTLTFLCNDAVQESAVVTWQDHTVKLPPLSTQVLVDGAPRFASWQVRPADRRRRGYRQLAFVPGISSLSEDIPTDGDEAPAPVEQLSLTHDTTDYCWYTTEFKADGPGELVLPGVADLVYLHVDQQFVTMTPPPLVERRGPYAGPAFSQRFTLPLAPGRHTLAILCCALGLVKGDGQVGGDNLADERKGLWGVPTWQGQPLPGPWRHRPGLRGEAQGWWQGRGQWQSGADGGRPLTWHLLRFPRPRSKRPLLVDLRGMAKGLAWLNGHCLGRYWLQPAKFHSAFKPGDPSMHLAPLGEPTQSYYFIPPEWLEDDNRLVLFDEVGGDPVCTRLLVRT